MSEKLTTDKGGIKIEGMENALQDLDKLCASKVAAIEQGMLKAGLHLQREAMKRCPVDTGALRSSAYTKFGKEVVIETKGLGGILGGILGKMKSFLTKDKSGKVFAKKIKLRTVDVGFTQWYAIFVHERLDLNHPVGEAKFLENAWKASRSTLTRIISTEVRRAK